ncbi:MAG: ethanolamine utilization microcompartment protein EutL [Eubacterium sp.]
MTGDLLKAHMLYSKLMTDIEDIMIEEFNLPEGHIDIGLFTTDNEDIGYIAADEATKKANVHVCYAKSTYGGLGCAYGGEMIGIISGPSISDVESGLSTITHFTENNANLFSAREDDGVQYYAQVISKIGSYLAEISGLPKGSSIAYLVAPPLESMMGVDEALTAADVEVVKFWGPPTVSNRGGAIVTGTQSACNTACQAFAKAVKDCVDEPVDY